MPKIAILNDRPSICSRFEGDQYVLDINRKFGGYQDGDLICKISPFFGIPLTLEIAIRKSGELIFRKWYFSEGENSYLHTSESKDFPATDEQKDTVNGLFSGRITFEGLRLSPGGTLQDICPIDIAREEKLIGKQIYLA